MSTEDLMKPRIKVIAPFPGMLKYGLNIDDILVGEDGVWENKNTGRDVQSYLYTFKDYPHLFKKLEWWHDRPISDLPHYVRFGELTSQHRFYKIAEWDKGEGFDKSFLDLYSPCGIAEIPKDYFISLRFANNYPATKEEYENQPK